MDMEALAFELRCIRSDLETMRNSVTLRVTGNPTQVLIKHIDLVAVVRALDSLNRADALVKGE